VYVAHAMSASISHSTAERLGHYDRLIATQPGVERKGATMPYTSVNGHMFSFLSESGTLALRLPPTERAAFLQRHATTLHEAHGTVMKEYVKVPEDLLGDTDRLSPYFAASYAYVAALKPKPTLRKR
jgi:TfoX/Sxy family transcriptional regulator of competence genes